ncbi:hypothetical protein E2562_030493 [Oryza meyeriana var. granulata]|uniref:Uncharacterized protein n=1 Tax=Oryza meyeriana var. granulata TaxID=110450 RepID=A0A6G1CVR8_9ORYZ|nr:hypothetical protein E2562_030493 [Oryza meyeriana var. granulata]
MDLDADMIPSSPSADYSSPSSSDLDTESTGSFFPDRSTTLGTLMGVSAFGGGQRRAARAPAGPERERTPLAAQQQEEEEDGRRAGGWRRRRRRQRRGRSLGRSWWRLCRDDAGGPPTSLGEFLDMERQLAGADFLCDGVGGGAPEREAAASVAATALFEDGRVRPPQPQPPAAEERGRWRLQRAAEGSSSSAASSLARLPVLLTGICSGGAG